MAKVLDFLEKVLFGDKKEVSLNTWTTTEETSSKLWAYQLALNIASERYGALLSKCEFKTYINGKEKKKDNYYLLNVEPNPNQSAAEFKKQLVRSLILRPTHDALVVNLKLRNGKHGLYVADDFQRDDMQLYEASFKNVSVDIFGDGGVNLQGVFNGDKAIYIKYANTELEAIFSMMRELYGDIVDNAINAGTYRQKYVLTMDQTAEASPDFEDHLQTLLNEQFGDFIKGKNSVIPLYAGMKLDQTSAGADLGQNASTANKSINSQIDEAITKVGLAFNIPKSIMLGDFEEDDLEHMLTYCIDPVADLISQAFTRKWYGYDGFKRQTYCKLDTIKARHLDMVDIAKISNSIISSGIYTINDVLKKLDEPLIEEEIGNVHFITRNYAVIGDEYLADPANSIQGTETEQQEEMTEEEEEKTEKEDKKEKDKGDSKDD